MEGACVDGSILLKWMGGTEWINLAQWYGTVHMVMHITNFIKYRPITCYEGPDREQNYSSTSSLTWALDCGWCLKPRPDCFTPAYDPVPVEQEAVRALGPGWNGVENSPPPGFAPWTVQPVASRIPTELSRHTFEFHSMKMFLDFRTGHLHWITDI